jgi:pimeloyl-ACP methyl ester carboxylesterase
MAQKPTLFDPRPYIAQLEIPILWVYGAVDQSQPVEKDLTVLRPLARRGKEFTIVVFPKVDHALQPSRTGKCVQQGRRLHPRLAGTLNRWLREHVG